MNLNYKATGFVIVDGNGVCVAVIINGVKQIIWKYNPDLPRRMGMGNARFREIRKIKESEYDDLVISKIEEIFITDEGMNVDKIVFAGRRADNIISNEIFDIRLSDIEVVHNVGYGMEPGLNDVLKKLGITYIRDFPQHNSMLF